MKFLSALALAASIAFVGAQDLTGIPNCALSCFAVAVPASGCSITDTTCQCTTGRESITNSITSCVPGKCSTDDIAKIAPAVTNLCLKAGITVSNLPTAVSTGGSAASTGSASKTTGGGSSTSTGTSAPQNTNVAVANAAGVGVIALGLAAALL